MGRDFAQISWNEEVADDCRQLVRLAVREDLGRWHDLTTVALVSENARGSAHIIARQPGILAGLPTVEMVLQQMNLDAVWQPQLQDGAPVDPGASVGRLAGATRDLLTAERLLLNLLGRLSGVATLTRAYVDAVSSTTARIYDTRKTTLGHRRLEKYAVRCGGGYNHRSGLYDAVLIKDNHLAHADDVSRPSQAVQRARQFLSETLASRAETLPLIEVEVDTLDQLDDALTARPDLVLLDNMTPDRLQEAVRRRDAAGVQTELEASGGITLQTVRQVAETGVERISVGTLTHSAISLDLALDWTG